MGFTPPCIASLLDPQNKPPLGHRHLVRQIISTHAFKEGRTIEDTIGKVMHTTDDPKKAESDVRGVYKTLERDPERYSVGCGEGSHLRALVDAGIAVCDEKTCQFKNKKVDQAEKKKEYSAWFDKLVDIVADDEGKTSYLVDENGTLAVKDKHELQDKILIPPRSEQIPWQLPRASEVLKYVAGDNDAQLFNDLVEYHKSISELPDENHYMFLAAWDIHTYFIEKFQYYPFVWFYAIPARGKSRTAKGIIYASWRGVIMTTVSEAHMIRLATNYKATIFLDAMDLWKKVERSGTEDLMLNRFERGSKYIRIQYPEKGPFEDTVWYDVGGPTIVATNKVISEILETRAVQIVMPESEKIFENDVLEINGLPFRERLVALRARWLSKQLPEVSKPVSGRLGDILKPIRQIVNFACSDEQWFLDFVRDMDESKKNESGDCDEAVVVKSILSSMGKVENGHLLHADTLGVINAGRSERLKMSPQRLGKIARRLGFNPYNQGSLRGIYIDQQLLERLCRRYGIRMKEIVQAV